MSLRNNYHMNGYRYMLVCTACIQLLFPYISRFSGGGDFTELFITPLGYTFSIWGAITSFSFVYAFWHAFFDTARYSKRFYIQLSLVYILFGVWLIVAEKNLLPITVVVFLGMVYLLQKPFDEILSTANLHTVWNKIFLQGGVGMYLGWSTIAVCINIGVWLFSYRVGVGSFLGIALQAGIVLLATVHALYMLHKYKRNIILFGTFWWACVGLLAGVYIRTSFSFLFWWNLGCIVILNWYFFRKENRR